MKRALLLLLVLSGCTSSSLLVYQNGSWEPAGNESAIAGAGLPVSKAAIQQTNTIPASGETIAPPDSGTMPDLGTPTHFL